MIIIFTNHGKDAASQALLPRFITIFDLLQPAFQVADNLRCVKSRNMLKTIVEDTTAAVEKLTKNQIQSQQLRDELPALEV